MRKVFSIIVYVIAGLCLAEVACLGFINIQAKAIKWSIMLVFLVVAAIALGGGLVLDRFHNWRRTTGIVLLSTSACVVFVVFTFACLMMTKEYRQMINLDTFAVLSDYVTGGAVIAGFTILGWVFLRTKKDCAEQDAPADAGNLRR